MSGFARDYRRLAALQAVGSGERVTQRGLAARLGVSLGSANGLLHELEAEGLIGMLSAGHARRLEYGLTGRGRRALGGAAGALAGEAEGLLAGLREELRAQARKLKEQGRGRVVLCGEGALGDAAACALLNEGLKLAGVVSRSMVGERVAGVRARPVGEAGRLKGDAGAGVSAADAAALRRQLGTGVPVAQLLSRARRGRKGGRGRG